MSPFIKIDKRYNRVFYKQKKEGRRILNPGTFPQGRDALTHAAFRLTEDMGKGKEEKRRKRRAREESIFLPLHTHIYTRHFFWLFFLFYSIDYFLVVLSLHCPALVLPQSHLRGNKRQCRGRDSKYETASPDRLAQILLTHPPSQTSFPF